MIDDRPAETASEPLQILVVDDDAQLAAVLVTAIESNGFRAIAATHPAEALAHAARVRFDIVVSDIDMPSMRGPELVGTLRRLQPRLAAIYMSGHHEHPDLPNDAFVIAKPFWLEELMTAIANCATSKPDDVVTPLALPMPKQPPTPASRCGSACQRHWSSCDG